MFKIGSIRKIEVKNFVTYNHVVLYPGPNLNILIGPNGTGKSTIVAAIILGLGGNPKIVGRGSKVSEYVKHNCEEARVDIYLQEEGEGIYVQITRIFTIKDKTTWLLNNQTVALKDIMNCITQYNIQVNNLCQFLPQDRVQEFAKLNQQELLKQTQIALCRDDLIEKQITLIEARKTQKELSEHLQQNSTKLKEAEDANLRLESKVENFNRKQAFLRRINDINRKIKWITYDKHYDKMIEVKNDLKTAEQIYKKHKSASEPIELAITQAQKKVSDLQKTTSNVTRLIREEETALRNYLEKVEDAKRNIQTDEDQMNARLAEIDQRNQEIEANGKKIEELGRMQQEIMNKCASDENVQEKIKKLTSTSHQWKRHINELQNNKEDVLQVRQEKGAQMRAFQNEFARLENVKQERLQHLRRIDNDAYEAVMWLRSNRTLFSGEIYDPIMLELDVLDQRHSIYVENVIPPRDRVAFTCVLIEDMNNLIRQLREGRNLTINVVHSSASDARRFQPSIPIEQLRRYGFHSYVSSLFKAPDPIMRYLCKSYRLHEIPIGSDKTNLLSDEVPKQIFSFFSDKRKYDVRFSEYTGVRSTKQYEIHSDGGLSISVDLVRLEAVKGELNEAQNSYEACSQKIKDYDNQINLLTDKVSGINEELKIIYTIKQQVQTIETRVSAMKAKIAEMKRVPNNEAEIRQQTSNKIKKKVKDMLSLMEQIKNSYKKISSLKNETALTLLKVESARQNAAYLENKNEELRSLVRDSETTLNQVKDIYGQVKAQAKSALQKAKSLSKEFTPEDAGFDEFRDVFNSLPSDLQSLNSEIDEINAQLDCLTTANGEQIKEYEERLRFIKEQSEKIVRNEGDLQNMNRRLDTLENQWLTPLSEFVTKINQNFASAFEKMGCAGEVSINRGENVKDYDQYGISIKVTYRNGEPLQELNNVVQSGGERAVATAVFMLSLQELTPVPFRCVDEINQGMDVTNERRIFQLLMESTSQVGTPQYFLITPKLIPKLNYSRTTMVHIVHNGAFVVGDRQWLRSRFCNPQNVGAWGGME